MREDFINVLVKNGMEIFTARSLADYIEDCYKEGYQFTAADVAYASTCTTVAEVLGSRN